MSTPIFHITHFRNLPSILEAGGLHCKATTEARGLCQVSIAHENIQDRRRRTRVPCGPGGVLHDYAPFFFCTKPPMLFTIARGNVEGYAEGQDPVVYLFSTVEKVMELGLPFVFTDGHGTVALTRFFVDPARLDQVDMPLMKAKYWFDTEEDGDRKRRRQAEFLVHNQFPLAALLAIVVKSEEFKTKVEELLRERGIACRVVVKPEWYY